ncbi:hypothetical protein LHGZ1_1342 [Laribacter hongkongensis]|uniref:Uncharacterized protein n=1 Tax=Laribacter hongkongensis TaxID=168471 RepID=A0A248LJ29_9NEIS|nr:hypothetical protein LHGZ1_1342 [Laribacter hongkongensis]
MPDRCAECRPRRRVCMRYFAVMWLVVSIEFHVNQLVMVFVFWHAMCI